MSISSMRIKEHLWIAERPESNLNGIRRPSQSRTFKARRSAKQHQDGSQSISTGVSPSAEPRRHDEQTRLIILRKLQELDVPQQTLRQSAYSPADNAEIIDHFLQHDEFWLGTPEIQRVLKAYALRWAVEAPYLMHVIMAASAAHLSYRNPSIMKYHEAETVHYVLSLKSFASQLNQPITRDNMDALIACSIIHGPLAFWQQSHDVGSPFGWLRTIRGVPAILNATPDKAWIEQSVWYQYSIEAGGSSEIALPEDPTILPWARDVTQKLQELCDVDTESTSIYAAPLRHFSKLLRMNNHRYRSSATLRFNGHLSAGFVDLLEEGDTRALLIFCYWYGLMCNVKQWWAETHAQIGCRRLCERLASCEDRRVQELLEWPMLQAGLISTPRW